MKSDWIAFVAVIGLIAAVMAWVWLISEGVL